MTETDKQGDAEASGPVAALVSFDGLIGRFEQGLVALFLALLIGIGAYQALVGIVLGNKPAWADEYLRFMVFFVAMSGAALAAQQKKLIAMDIVSRLAPPRVRLFIKIATALFSVAACAWLALAANELRASALSNEAGEGFITQYDAMLALPLALWLIVFHLVVSIAVMVQHLVRGTLPVEEAPSGH